MIRIKKILCPVDFFPASLKAFDHALRLASNYEAGVHALHVVSPIVPTALGFPVDISEYTEALQQVARRDLLKLKKKAERAGIPFSSEVLIGDIGTDILETRERLSADLVVMGTHGRRGFERWILGSETDRLIRRCPVPVLTARMPDGARVATPSFRRILVTTDFSAGTGEAINYAFSIAQECQARVTLLHVIDSVAIEAAPEMEAQVVSGVRRQLEDLVPIGAGEWPHFKIRVAAGVPYQTILKVQEAEKVDLLVMNIHGKGIVDRALVGSTAERVVRGATCPVLLVPPRAQAGKASRKRRKAA